MTRNENDAHTATAGDGGERVRHVKRGTEYEVLGEAEAQVSGGIWIPAGEHADRLPNARLLFEGRALTVYRCATTGKLWCRFTDEFRDGRFETIAQDPAVQAPAGVGEALSEEERDENRHAAKKADAVRRLYAATPSPAQEPGTGDTGETFETIRQWCEDTFGPITPERTVERAGEEFEELRAEPHNVTEAADVVIVLSRYPGLWTEIERKMKINRARRWRLMGDGTGYHIKESTPATTAETRGPAEGAR